MKFVRLESARALSRSLLRSFLTRETWLLQRRAETQARRGAGERVTGGEKRAEQTRFLEALEADKSYQKELCIQRGLLAIVPERHRTTLFELMDDPVGTCSTGGERVERMESDLTEAIMDFLAMGLEILGRNLLMGKMGGEEDNGTRH